MVTRNVVLTQHQHELLQSWVDSGRFQNASEALRAGLRLLEREDEERSARLAALHRVVDHGWSDIAASRFDDVAEDDLERFIGRLGTRARLPQPNEG